ncbi:MAG: DUF6464 family protein, partial [bacterium]
RMRVELRLSGSDRLLGNVEMGEWSSIPHPGRWIELQSKEWFVVQRRHRYRYWQGRYQLSSVILEVKQESRPRDAEWWNGQWVIGNPSCHFNARSPLLRCAVLPEGPCECCS